MNTTVKNIVREINDLDKNVFTKKEIIDYIVQITSNDNLSMVESNGVVVDPETHTITIGENKCTPPKKILYLLHYLITNKNKILTRSNILYHVWGNDVIVFDRTIDVHIKKLRDMVPDGCIKTIKNVGYCWIEKEIS